MPSKDYLFKQGLGTLGSEDVNTLLGRASPFVVIAVRGGELKSI